MELRIYIRIKKLSEIGAYSGSVYGGGVYLSGGLGKCGRPSNAQTADVKLPEFCPEGPVLVHDRTAPDQGLLERLAAAIAEVRGDYTAKWSEVPPLRACSESCERVRIADAEASVAHSRNGQSQLATDPVAYLKERADNSAMGAEELKRRLRTHLIPYKQLAVGYGGMSDDERRTQVKGDYDVFLSTRAEILVRAAQLACTGKTLELSNLFSGTD